ncbi:hypothetical protein Dda_4862 [Drechslerella dactyloides]|uniref:Uncharacterized protein n=1 Tax=Drechslerella dactyloides TaxID=74499 RepID=A0AAD6NJR7_DREDA|nr:hypothetical protein Dda_4862 [Drechslerella dactyloides]
MKFAYISVALFAALATAAPQPQRGGRPTRITSRVPPRPTPTKKCDMTLCADAVNECGMMYGGCFPACPGWPTPTFTPPPCPTPKKCDIILCSDAVNECGMMYGGCFEACPDSPTPTFTPPPCPSGWDKGHGKPGKGN